ncbi:MAG: protein-disulfide reductase DsbD domain-containing protein [Deltaproteobacteria bacterium]
MTKFKLLIALFALLFCLSSAVFAEPPHPIRAKLVSDVAAVKPGAAFTLGVLFHLDPGWHIYWKNSGSSGLPTSIALTLPDGFEAGEIQWPTPASFNRSGGTADYGYENSVMLFASVKSPKNLSFDSDIPIRAKVSWVSCDDVCLPGKTELRMTLSAAKSAAPANSELFRLWQGRLPVRMDSPKAPFKSKIAGGVDGGSSGNFSVVLDWKVAPSWVDLLPAPEGALAVDNLSVQHEGGRTLITFSARVYSGQKLSSEALETVVAYRGEGGDTRGVTLAIPLRSRERL